MIGILLNALFAMTAMANHCMNTENLFVMRAKRYFFTLDFKYGFGNIAQEDIEVIGNIFDNPELLEGGETE